MLILLLGDETSKYEEIFQVFLNFQVFALVVPVLGVSTEAAACSSVFHCKYPKWTLQVVNVTSALHLLQAFVWSPLRFT